jgi:hypothetical protein
LVFFGTAFSLVDFLILQTVTFFGYSALLWKAVLVFLTACSAVLWKAVSVALLCCSAVLWKAVSVALLTACSAVLWKAVLVALLTDYCLSEDRACCLDGALFSLRISRLDGL